MPHQNRQLAAILFTDIVGYTSMMQQDEQTAVAVNKRYLAVLKQSVSSHGGEILNDFGDGSLCTFTSATEAVKCAMEMQQQLQMEPKVPLRIGLHIGEIFFEDGKVFGDGVNIASRIQSLGIANSILFSSEINSKLKNQQNFKCVSVGRFHFKNVDEPMEVFALCNEGLIVPKKEEMSGKLKEIEKKSTYRRWLVAAAIVIIATIGFFIYKSFSSVTGFKGEKTIAVLPFENIGTDSSEVYVSDGITQDIISSLSKISSLKKVIGWFSVRGFKNTTKPLNEIAKELSVAAILSGSMQKQGDKTRIIVELIEVNTNNLLWRRDFEYDSKDLLTVQSKISGQIIIALEASITPEEKKELSKQYTENVEAYKLYRRGRWFWDKRTRESYDSAESNYKRALDLDPDYALAYAGLADCYTFNQKGLSQLEGVPIARNYTIRALMLDSNLTEALTTRAFIQSHFDYDWKGAKTSFEKLIHNNPNYPTAHLYYGNVLFLTGFKEAGFGETKKALALDPLSSVINTVLGRNYYYARHYDSSITQLQTTLTLNPGVKAAYQYLGYSYLQKKQYPQAIGAFSKIPPGPFEMGVNRNILLIHAYSVSGDKEKAITEFEKISKEERLLLPPLIMANFYISLGNFNEALTELERGFDTHSISMMYLGTDPVLDPIRNEPRFKELLKKMNLN